MVSKQVPLAANTLGKQTGLAKSRWARAWLGWGALSAGGGQEAFCAQGVRLGLLVWGCLAFHRLRVIQWLCFCVQPGAPHAGDTPKGVEPITLPTGL